MSRRSRSQRPQKTRQSERPVEEATATVKGTEPALSPERSGVVQIDELAAVDAGWDELLMSS